MRTTIDVDTRIANAVSKVLGTRTLKDTVNMALREVLAASRRRMLIERIQKGLLPAPTPRELARLRAPQLETGILTRQDPRT